MAAILKIRYDVITPPTIVRLLRNLASRCKMTCRWQYIRQIETRNRITVWRPSVFWNRSSFFISAMDWDISSKFGMEIDFHLLKQMPSLNLKTGVDFRLYGRHLENSIWRHNSAADHPISTKFGRQVQNDTRMSTHTSK